MDLKKTDLDWFFDVKFVIPIKPSVSQQPLLGTLKGLYNMVDLVNTHHLIQFLRDFMKI